MDNKKHYILFVDDDVLILRGFARSLDDYTDDWGADFAASGQSALEKLAKHPFDAVVTDMHMPGMDGIQLLEAVSQNMPNVMRFVLSGNTSDAQILKSTHLVHQMIPKPCDMAKIFDIVERACRLRDMLSNPQLLKVVTGIKTLPSSPQLYNRLVKELQSENASVQVVGDLIAMDAAMTAKILQLVNSAFFGLSTNVSSPHKAAAMLGLNTIKALVLGIQVFAEYPAQAKLPFSMEGVWKHSMLVSSMAYAIAKSLDLTRQEQEDARIAGILHDIGKLILFSIPNAEQIIHTAKGDLASVEEEYQGLGTSHAEMGAYLLGIWGLPQAIVEAVTFHHRPDLQLSEKPNIITALYVANGLINVAQMKREARYSDYLDLEYLKKAKLGSYLEEWIRIANNLVGQVK